jgi:hypothetical protein
MFSPNPDPSLSDTDNSKSLGEENTPGEDNSENTSDLLREPSLERESNTEENQIESPNFPEEANFSQIWGTTGTMATDEIPGKNAFILGFISNNYRFLAVIAFND